MGSDQPHFIGCLRRWNPLHPIHVASEPRITAASATSGLLGRAVLSPTPTPVWAHLSSHAVCVSFSRC